MKTVKMPTKSKEQQVIDSKSAQLSKIMYAAIVRYIKSRSAQIKDKKANFALDAERRRSYVVDSDT